MSRTNPATAGAASGLRVEQIDRGGLQNAVQNPITAPDCLSGRIERKHESPRGGRGWNHLEVHHRESGQRSEGADDQLGHVQAGDILHDHTARIDQLAGHRGELHPDDHVSGGSVKPPAGAGAVRGHHAAHRRAIRKRRIERDHLAVLSENAAQFRERQPGFGADGEIPRLVLQNPGHRCRRNRRFSRRDRPGHGILG